MPRATSRGTRRNGRRGGRARHNRMRDGRLVVWDGGHGDRGGHAGRRPAGRGRGRAAGVASRAFRDDGGVGRAERWGAMVVADVTAGTPAEPDHLADLLAAGDGGA